MLYILDTDILSLLAHEDSNEAPHLRRHVAELPPSDSIVTTIINYEELMRGWMAFLAKTHSPSEQVRAYARLFAQLEAFRRIKVLPYDQGAAQIAESLKKTHPRIGRMDLKVAAVVIAADGTLITRNVRDFNVVKGLRVDDWSS
jgi:tRNA(fMet)-specific endonuclease VapC